MIRRLLQLIRDQKPTELSRTAALREMLRKENRSCPNPPAGAKPN